MIVILNVICLVVFNSKSKKAFSQLLAISTEKTTLLDAFKRADEVLLQGVSGITDLITTPGLINLDFADVKSVMQGAGSALMGIGSARGADRAIKAAELAVESPLLEASIEVTSRFVNGGEVVSTRGRRESDQRRYNAVRAARFPDVPIVVLVNGGSASAASSTRCPSCSP